MGVVLPFSICLCEDDVLRTSSGISYEVLVCFVHKCLRWIPSFLSLPVACTTTVPSLVWAPNNGEDFPCNMWIFNALPNPSRDLPIKACHSSHRVNTRPLSTNNLQVTNCPLYTNSPWVITCPLSTNNPRVTTRQLYLHRVLQVGTYSFSPRVYTRSLSTYSHRVITRPLHLCRILPVGACSSSALVYTCSLHPHSHEVVTLLLCLHSHRVITRPL